MERVQSLRTRKPQQGRSSKLSKPPPASPSTAVVANDDEPPPKARPRPRDKDRKSRVDDKIKRRMSMRYAISGPTDTHGVPDMPSMPVLNGQTRPAPTPTTAKARTDDREPSKRDPKAIDVHILDKEDFNPDAYLKVKLANSTESEIKSLQSSLEGAKASLSNDLQTSVVKNYAEFFLLSKEISTLENDMLELKESLSEWKSMPSLLHIDDSVPMERRRTNRSSAADLKVLYADQIQALHTRIEGSSKFVPATPGRHIVSELSDITSLNSASYKPEQSVHFVLLDDALLVARNRRRRDEREGKLAAIRCWNLADIVVLDIKDSPELSNVFKIKDGKNVHVFRTEKPSDKRSLLASFREVAAEFSAKKRKQRETEHERRRSVWAGNGRPPPGNENVPMPELPAWLKEIGADMSRDESQSAKEKHEKDMRWVNEYGDNLAVAIALRDWDEAVSLVETGEERLSSTPSLGPKLSPLKASLIRALLLTLSEPSHRKASVVHLTSLLIRLGSGVSARTTFLSTRTELLRKRMRMIVFEGDTTTYIGELATVVFTSIKHSADWYFGSFREHESASTFVQWAKEQVQVYVDMFKTQVYNSDVNQTVVDECTQITFQQSRRLLGENGLDFSFLLDQILVPPQEARLPAFRKRLSTSRVPLVSSEQSLKLNGSGNGSTSGTGSPSPGGTGSPRPRQARIMAVPPRSMNRPGSVIDREANR